LFLITIRKMLSNKWMLICTLLGSIITVALLSSIPTYTGGITQRMLVKDFESFQQQTGKFPGAYQINYNDLYVTRGKDSFKTFQSFGQKIKNNIKKSDIPILTETTYESAGEFNIPKTDSGKMTFPTLCSLSDIEKHIKLIDGKMSSKNIENGVYEIILSEQGMQELDLTLGNTYILSNETSMRKKADIREYKIKVVGIFTYKTLDDPYWYNSMRAFNSSVIMDQDLMEKSIFIDPKISLDTGVWYFAYDYHKLKFNKLKSLLATFKENDEFVKNSNLTSTRPADSILKQNQERASTLEITLIIFEIPIIVILSFYSFMISKLKIDFESNEISIIKSRGGSSLLVFCTYLIESFIIGIISLLIGPIIGLYLCKLLGASNGFLEFVQRPRLPSQLSLPSYLYSIAAVIFISLSMLIPAYIASRTSIVLYKQKNAHHKKRPFWEKFFIDILLLALASYGLYGYKKHQLTLLASGMDAADMVIDPLLFIISTLFIFGCGLFFLRVFPHIVRFIFWLGRKVWNPVFYASFIQVGRSSGWERFTMLFIIMALSIGIFSSNSARTINKNMEEKIFYNVGADTVVQGYWADNQPPEIPTVPGEPPPPREKVPMYYYEQPFELYQGLTSAQSVTKVFKNDECGVSFGGEYKEQVSLMGIIPNEFGKTAWFRPDLLPFHWYQYLNLMTANPSAIFVSKAFKDNLRASEGYTIDISWGEKDQPGSSISGTIYGFLDYWPTLNPNKKTNDEPNPYFIVANLDYIQATTSIEPYQVWIKKKPGISTNDITKEITDKKIEILSITDSEQNVIAKKNDPMLQGTNGSLTLGFIVTLIITIVGFLIYWILSIKKRILQFGIFRAIGITSREIIGMISCEQLLITGSSIFAGIQLGNIASKIFVPLFEMVYSSDQQVPPFKVISDINDYLRLYTIMALMLILCFYIIGRLISKINISQALKLGED